MVLDIHLFRAEKGGDQEKMRENQKNRFKDEKLVELIIQKDNKWRLCKFMWFKKNAECWFLFIYYYSTISTWPIEKAQELCKQKDWREDEGNFSVFSKFSIICLLNLYIIVFQPIVSSDFKSLLLQLLTILSIT